MGTRIVGGGAEKVYEAANEWVERALRSDDSLFTPGKPIWTSQWLREVRERFLDQPDDSDRSFLDKLRDQLANSPPELYQLVGEALYFYFLIVSTKNSADEQQVIDTVLGWAPAPAVIPPHLVAALTPGIAGPGQQFHSGRPFQVGFLIELVEQWKEQGPDERQGLLANPWEFKDFVVRINFRSALLRGSPNRPRAQREALLHLVFPDTFESIVSVNHKEQIATKFAHLVTEPTEDIDRQLAQIRMVLAGKFEEGDHFFYKLRVQWDDKHKRDSGVGAEIDDEDDQPPPEPTQPDLQALADSVFLPVDFLERIHTLVEDKKQVIFQGPPGTGKTYVAQALAKHLAGSKERVTLVQFHPSYAYEDFVQGFRPTLRGGQPGFELRDGPLLRAAEQARREPCEEHFLVIDEINRGNIAKVFGELYFLLEYRDSEMQLQYSDTPFSLPSSLHIIGTMNTADRSIALVDLALRRRFYFVEFHPDEEPVKGVLRRWLGANGLDHMAWVADAVKRANEKPQLKQDRHAAIGPSYFMKPGLDEAAVGRIWKHSVLPYIEERLFVEGEGLAEFHLDALRRSAAGGREGDQNRSSGADGDGDVGGGGASVPVNDA